MAEETGIQSSDMFEPVQQRRVFDEIIVQVERAIVDGRLSVGDQLPPERELARIFRVSRPAVREALRVLEAFGVISARRGTGPESGSIVTNRQEVGLGSLLRMHVSLMRIPLSDLLEVRTANEQVAARAVARRASEEDLEELDAIVEVMCDVTLPKEFLELDGELHLTIARLSGNLVASLLMDALRRAIASQMLSAFEAIEDFESERKNLVEEHRELISLMRAHDEDGAARAMEAHITGFYGRLGSPEDLSPA